MLKIRVIPCLDIDNGRVVKGINFLNLTDAGDPLELAKFYAENGADELCFLDITASSDNRETTYDLLHRIAGACFVPITIGGGVKTVNDIGRLLRSGADKVAINTMAINSPQLIAEASNKYGAQCIVLSVDAKKHDDGQYYVYTHGGRTKTDFEVKKWVKFASQSGAGEILLTSMDCDGTKSGIELTITKQVAELVNIPIIASGGIGNKQDFVNAVQIGKASAVLAASVFHFGELEINNVKSYMQAQGVRVRL